MLSKDKGRGKKKAKREEGGGVEERGETERERQDGSKQGQDKHQE